MLLYGPPGTGKTMLARAVAAEAGVAFLHVSGSEFVEKYVGVGARRVRDLFAQARALGRAVVFVDEFDALAKARGGPNGHEEREQTLNQLLVELDGFAPNDNIVVIAATNRLDVLDAAVLRPGRFNRKIHVGLPDVRGRREILAVHARHKPLDRRRRPRQPRPQDLRVLGRPARGPAQRGRDPGGAPAPAEIDRDRRPPGGLAQGGGRAPAAGGRWTSASARSSRPTRSATRSAAGSTGTAGGSRRSACSPTARRWA